MGVSDQARSLRWNRWAGYALSASALGFAFCLGWAAFLYPGGTWCEPQKAGYDVVRSFFCDLLHTRGLNGAPNPGAPLARAGLLLAGVAFIPFWLGTPRALGLGARRALVIRGLGGSSALLCLAVALTPSDSWPTLHQIAVLSASTTGVVAALLAVSAPAARRGRWLRRLGWAALGTAALDAGLYAEQVFFPKPCATLLPALQKLSALWVVVWMFATAWVLLRRGGLEVTEIDPNRTR
jgi:hypothetical protein